MNLAQLKTDIFALYEACLENTTPFHRKLDLFLVPEDLVQKILEATQLDVSGHWVSIDNFGIIHALEQHGNPLFEAKRGQIAIEKEDFARFIEVLLNPDEIMSVGVTKRTNLPLIQFVKILEGKKIVVKEIRTITSLKKQKLSRIVFHTMYKTKAAK
jgi:hypothetical protein